MGLKFQGMLAPRFGRMVLGIALATGLFVTGWVLGARSTEPIDGVAEADPAADEVSDPDLDYRLRRAEDATRQAQDEARRRANDARQAEAEAARAEGEAIAGRVAAADAERQRTDEE